MYKKVIFCQFKKVFLTFLLLSLILNFLCLSSQGEIPQKIIYYDEDYPTWWVSRNIAIIIKDYFTDMGFVDMYAEKLAEWMKKVIDNKVSNTVIIIPQDVTYVLAKNNELASGWLKNYNSNFPKSGFIRIWDMGLSTISPSMLSDLYCLATGKREILTLEKEIEEDFGYFISSNKDFSIFWSEATYKIFKEKKIPDSKKDYINISCARNEYEPFQLVINPKIDLKNVKIKVSDLKNEKGGIIKKKNIEINLVEYVEVIKPSDYSGHTGFWPDPLPLYLKPFDAKKNENKPLWFTIYVPEDAGDGVYEGKIIIKPEHREKICVQLKVKVFNFALPEETHTRTAYGVGLNTDYHNLKEQEDIIKTFDLYMENCKKHRISPYSPMCFHPIKQDIDCKTGEVSLDFSSFDKAAERYLDEFKFNGFNFGGIPQDLCGYKIFTPEFNELHKKIYGKITEHLKEKGWLSKTYCYWVDEPPLYRWDYVKKGMDLLKENCPDLKRLLTINTDFAPTISFYNYVDIWVPIFHLYHPKRAKFRQKKGEEVWWYVCCEPKAPYPNNFIDHPAIAHRIRFWMMQKFAVDGDLYWSTTYWAQNPWEIAMSYSPEGGEWGNGDGRLLYPPQKEIPKKPLISGPVNSIRFEMIREGLEDKEYFWILEQEIKRLKEEKGKNYDEYIRKAKEALDLANSLVKDLFNYEKDPKKLYLAREKIAEVIEELREVK